MGQISNLKSQIQTTSETGQSIGDWEVEEPRNAKSEQDPKPQKPLSLSPFSPGTGFGAAGWKPAIRPDAEI
jgi:hypothetical protein